MCMYDECITVIFTSDPGPDYGFGFEAVWAIEVMQSNTSSLIAQRLSVAVCAVWSLCTLISILI